MTSEPAAAAPAPPVPGLGRSLAHFAADVLLYLLLTVVFAVAVLGGLAAGGATLQPPILGAQSLTFVLWPCREQAGRTDALHAYLRQSGELRRSPRRSGREFDLELFPARIEGRMGLMFAAEVVPPPGEAVAIDETGLAEATGCAVRDFAMVPSAYKRGHQEPLAFGPMPTAVIAGSLLSSVLAGLTAWLLRRPRKELSVTRSRWRPAMATGLLAGIAFPLVASAAESAGLPIDPSNADMLQALTAASPLLAALLIIIAAPVAEEMFFRGVLLRRFLLAGRPMLGLFLSSGLFALAHELFSSSPPAERLATTAIYLLGGLVMGSVYLRTGRLAAAIAAHVAANATAMLFLAGA